MFDKMADEIFAEAGVDKALNPAAWDEARNILSATMARLSVSMGLSAERVEVFELQKRTLVEDLVEGKADGVYK